MFGNRERGSSKRIQIRYHLYDTTQRGTLGTTSHDCVCVFVCIMRMREYVFNLSMPIALRRLSLVGTNQHTQHTFLPLHSIIYGLEFSNEYSISLTTYLGTLAEYVSFFRCSFHSKYLQTPTPFIK